MFTSHLICRRLIPQVRNTPILHHSKIPQFTSRAIRSTSRHNTLSRVRVQKTPFEEIPTNKGPILPTTIAKAFLFTGAFSAGCFMGATIWEYEGARSLMLERAKKSKFPWSRQAEDKSHYFAHVKKDISTFWNSLSQGERVFAPICALNLVVFALWRVPRLQNVMMTYFCSNPAARIVCWPMFLSTMSHYSLFHIFANMYVLHSFSSPAVLALGKEQFTAMYLSAGVIASLASVVVKTVTKTPGLSLGASGAIMAILAYVCTKFPDTQLSILFLPMVTFPAGSAIKVIMGLDLAGVLFGWKFFDHAAHLGGAAFGVFWAFYGQELWQKRIKFLSMYHDWRKTNH